MITKRYDGGVCIADKIVIFPIRFSGIRKDVRFNNGNMYTTYVIGWLRIDVFKKRVGY